MQKTIAQRQQKEKKSLTWKPQLRAQIEHDSTLKRPRPHPSLTRANFFPQRNLCLPEKTQCFVQIPTFKSHPWCSSSNAICQQWLAKHNQNRKFAALLCSSPLFSAGLCSTLPLYYSIIEFYLCLLLLLCSALLYLYPYFYFYSALLYFYSVSPLLCSTFLSFTLPCSTLLYYGVFIIVE